MTVTPEDIASVSKEFHRSPTKMAEAIVRLRKNRTRLRSALEPLATCSPEEDACICCTIDCEDVKRARRALEEA